MKAFQLKASGKKSRFLADKQYIIGGGVTFIQHDTPLYIRNTHKATITCFSLIVNNFHMRDDLSFKQNMKALFMATKCTIVYLLFKKEFDNQAEIYKKTVAKIEASEKRKAKKESGVNK